MATYRCCQWTQWVVVPLLITLVALLVMFIEFRVGLQYITTELGVNWQVRRYLIQLLGYPACSPLPLVVNLQQHQALEVAAMMPKCVVYEV